MRILGVILLAMGTACATIGTTNELETKIKQIRDKLDKQFSAQTMESRLAKLLTNLADIDSAAVVIGSGRYRHTSVAVTLTACKSKYSSSGESTDRELVSIISAAVPDAKKSSIKIVRTTGTRACGKNVDVANKKTKCPTIPKVAAPDTRTPVEKMIESLSTITDAKVVVGTAGKNKTASAVIGWCDNRNKKPRVTADEIKSLVANSVGGIRTSSVHVTFTEFCPAFF